MTASRIIPFVLLVIAAPACILSPDIVGETLTRGQLATSDTTDSGAATDSGSTTSAGPVTMTTVATRIDPTEGGLVYGDPCEFGPPQAWEETSAPPDPDEPVKPQATILDVNDRCAGGMCLLAYDHPVLPPSCELDAECGPNGVCSDGECVLSPEFLADNARCSQACEVDTDCPAIPNCELPAVCSPIAKLGPLCCEKVCVCLDHTGQGTLDMIKQECAKGLEWCQ